MENRHERAKAMRKVQKLHFAMLDAAEFLDGHPDNASALRYHKRMQEQYDQAKREYQKQFGPLTHGTESDTHWQWIDDPWPWEGEG